MNLSFDKLLEYVNLPERSIVIDGGAYEGQFSKAVLKKQPNILIYAFEPNPHAFAVATYVLANQPVELFQRGLGYDLRDRKLYINYESSSVYPEWAATDKWITFSQIKTSGFLQSLKEVPQLVKLNCEGAEYEILQDLLETNWIKKIPQFLIQFHDVPGKWNCTAELEKTHERTYDFKWQVWRKK